MSGQAGDGWDDDRSQGGGGRTPVTLACSECKSRNYKTTKSADPGAARALEIKKYCKQCKKHTLHRETK
jgi:large subunit ribosomal protein L33